MLRNLSKEQEGLVREFLLRGRQLNAAEEREALDCVAQMLFSRVPPGMRDAPLLSPEYSLPDWVCYRIADFFHSDDGPIAIRPVTEFRDGDRDMHIAAYIHELTANKNIKWEAAVEEARARFAPPGKTRVSRTIITNALARFRDLVPHWARSPK